MNSDRKFNFIKKEDESSLLMACNVNKKNINLWYLDIEYSNYIKEDKSFFLYLNKSYQDFIKFKVFFIRKGMVAIQNKCPLICPNPRTLAAHCLAPLRFLLGFVSFLFCWNMMY